MTLRCFGGCSDPIGTVGLGGSAREGGDVWGKELPPACSDAHGFDGANPWVSLGRVEGGWLVFLCVLVVCGL